MQELDVDYLRNQNICNYALKISFRFHSIKDDG